MAFLRKLAGECEATALARAVGCDAPMRLFQAKAIALSFFLKSVECVLNAGNGAERRDSLGKINLVIGPVR